MTLQRFYAWFGFFTFWAILLVGIYQVAEYIYQANLFLAIHG